MTDHERTEALEELDDLYEPGPPVPFWRRRLLWIVLLAALLAAVVLVFLHVQRNRPPDLEPFRATVELSGETVEAGDLIYQNEDSGALLLNANALLSLLGAAGQWGASSPSMTEVRFSERESRVTVYILNNWKDLQIYRPDSGITVYSGEDGAAVIRGRAYVPLSFVGPWLGMEASYSEEGQTLRLEPEDAPMEPLRELSESAPESEASAPPLEDEQPEESAPSSSEESVPEEAGPDTLTYTYLDGGAQRERSIYIYAEGDRFGFGEVEGAQLTQANYAAVGSPSQPEYRIYQSADGKTVGIITGWFRPDKTVLYGVLSLERMDWIVPCLYEDLYLEGDTCFGRLEGAGVREIGKVLLPES